MGGREEYKDTFSTALEHPERCTGITVHLEKHLEKTRQ